MLSGRSISRSGEEFSIGTASGSLAAVLHRPAGDAEWVVVFCHGFRGSKEGGGRAEALTAKVAALGYAAVRFDFTPLGTLSRQVAELAAVVAWCREALGGRVILLGRSMGGSAALATAAADRRVAGLALWATPHDLDETFRLALGAGYDRLARGEELDVCDEYGALSLTPGFVADFAAFDLLAAVDALAGRPLLVVHGEEDAVVPVRQAREVFARAGEPKELALVPGGDHQLLVGHERATTAVLAWLAKMFPPGGRD